MPSFLVEAYAGAGTDVAGLEARGRAAVAELEHEGLHARYLRAIFVPGDEICFHLFQADSLEAVRRASERAGLDHHRIVEALAAGDAL